MQILRTYVEEFGTAEDGRLFRSPSGGRLDSTRYLDGWHKARRIAFPPHLVALLARRPYDLRHAAVSLWLNSGVPAAEVAEMAGHSVAILMDTYYKCIHGQREQMVQRIIDALSEDRKAGRQAKWTRPRVFAGALLAQSLWGATKRDETRWGAPRTTASASF
ncbi:hypothetical protein ACFY20_06375 [Streptomyces sp. NPDC001312]|uniref:hypothetical protein n=1 Tax=Streptomyces sp. NPDC001312 TaxID=3364561 RepID=UPI0036A08E62